MITKIEKTKKGNLLLRNASDIILYILPPHPILLPKVGTVDTISICESLGHRNNVDVKASDITHFNGVANAFTTQQLLSKLETVQRVGLFGDYVDSYTDSRFQLQQDYVEPSEIQMIKTTITGSEILREFYLTQVEDLSQISTLWTNRDSDIYDNLINL